MSEWSRRNVLRLSAAGAAAVAVPLTAAGVMSASASPESRTDRLTKSEIDKSGTGRVMLFVHDAENGEVSVLQGGREVIFKDHKLVARIMRAAAPEGS